MNYLLICGFLVRCIICEAANSVFIAPVEAPGNSANIYPFLLAEAATMRYQQVFAASSFGQLPPGGGTITKLWLSDGTVGIWGCCWSTTIPSGMQINLSTTSRAPDSLSSVFADNVGAGETVVVPQSFTFNGQISLSQPFFYNPSQGNLLIDVRMYSGIHDPFSTQGPLAAQNVTGDSISRAYAVDVNATTASATDTRGVLMGFTITPVPEPSTLWLLGAGLIGISVRLWRTNSKNKPNNNNSLKSRKGKWRNYGISTRNARQRPIC